MAQVLLIRLTVIPGMESMVSGRKRPQADLAAATPEPTLARGRYPYVGIFFLWSVTTLLQLKVLSCSYRPPSPTSAYGAQYAGCEYSGMAITLSMA